MKTMRKSMLMALAVVFMLSAKAQIVQTLNLKDGSQLHGYMKSQKPGNSCVFYAENAEVLIDRQKVKNINTQKMSYNNLPEAWKKYADENGLLDKKKEMTLSSIDTGAVINHVRILEEGLTVRYVELKHDYTLRWKDIASIEYVQRDDLQLSGVNHNLKVKEDGLVRMVTGQIIKKIPGDLTVILKDDGVKVSIKTQDIVRDNLMPNNTNQTLFEQSVLLDEVRMKDGETLTGIIVENNYEEDPNCITVVEKSVETPRIIRMSDIAEYRYIPNSDYVEVRDVELNPGDILVNRNEAKQVMLSMEQSGFVVRPTMERVTLKHEGKDFEVCVEANFKEEKEMQDNYLIKTRKFTKDKKRRDWNYFTYKDMIESSVASYENVTSMNNTTKISYKVKDKGTYVFYNSTTKKAVVIVVE